MAYQLANSFAGDSLISDFTFVDGGDPNRGCVAYKSQEIAEKTGLLLKGATKTGVVRLRADSWSTLYPGQGRPSLRIESRQTYNGGLFIGDFLHMPAARCGVWPAFWAYGDDWPKEGEIDIIEGVSTARQNLISAHTTPGCILHESLNGQYVGQLLTPDCSVNRSTIGCGFHPPANVTSSYGDGFNAVGGGVYAMLWDDKFMKIWHFERNSIPRDITLKQPDPSTWPKPYAIFGGPNCTLKNYFMNMRLVLNINFCGDFGNALWGKTDNCNVHAYSCDEYIARNPQDLTEVYWDVRYIEVYQPSRGAGKAKAVARALSSQPDPSVAILHSAGPSGSPFLSRNSSDPASPSGVPYPLNNSSRPAGAGLQFPSGTGPTAPFPSGTAPTAPLPSGTAPTAPSSSSAAELPLGIWRAANPPRVRQYAYLGCFGSRSGFPTFDLVQDSPDMTASKCVGACDGKAFAAVLDSECYCASEVDAGTGVASPGEAGGGVCNFPCPGNSLESCGSGGSTGRPGLSSSDFVSVYGAIGDSLMDGPMKMPIPPPVAPGAAAEVAYADVGTVEARVIEPRDDEDDVELAATARSPVAMPSLYPSRPQVTGVAAALPVAVADTEAASSASASSASDAGSDDAASPARSGSGSGSDATAIKGPPVTAGAAVLRGYAALAATLMALAVLS